MRKTRGVLGSHSAWGAKAADAVKWCGSALRADLHAQGMLVRTGRMSLGDDSVCWAQPWQLRAGSGFSAGGVQWGPSAPSG